MSTIDKVKNVLHPNNGHSTTSTTGTGSTLNTGTAGGYSGANTGVTGTSGSTTTAPHSSKIANTLDPRIESNGNRNAGGGISNSTNGGLHSNTRGTTGNYSGAGTGLNNTTGSTNAGPHSSNIANTLDPRIDSDRGGSRNVGGASGTSSTGAYSGTQTGNHIGHTGDRGGISNSTNAGPHDSNLGNKLDPRVDSDLDGRGNRHGATNGGNRGILGASGSHATPGSGTAQNTAGPHNSDIANKLDPRVDSDLSGGRTIGGNLTNA